MEFFYFDKKKNDSSDAIAIHWQVPAYLYINIQILGFFKRIKLVHCPIINAQSATTGKIKIHIFSNNKHHFPSRTVAISYPDIEKTQKQEIYAAMYVFVTFIGTRNAPIINNTRRVVSFYIFE